MPYLRAITEIEKKFYLRAKHNCFLWGIRVLIMYSCVQIFIHLIVPDFYSNSPFSKSLSKWLKFINYELILNIGLLWFACIILLVSFRRNIFKRYLWLFAISTWLVLLFYLVCDNILNKSQSLAASIYQYSVKNVKNNFQTPQKTLNTDNLEKTRILGLSSGDIHQAFFFILCSYIFLPLNRIQLTFAGSLLSLIYFTTSFLTLSNTMYNNNNLTPIQSIPYDNLKMPTQNYDNISFVMIRNKIAPRKREDIENFQNFTVTNFKIPQEYFTLSALEKFAKESTNSKNSYRPKKDKRQINTELISQLTASKNISLKEILETNIVKMPRSGNVNMKKMSKPLTTQTSEIKPTTRKKNTSRFSQRLTLRFWQYGNLAREVFVVVIILFAANLIGSFQSIVLARSRKKIFNDAKKFLENRINLEIEKDQQDKLLLSVIPPHITEEVKQAMLEKLNYKNSLRKHSFLQNQQFHEMYVVHHKNVSILYSDIVNFTPLSQKLSPERLVQTLNELFASFDLIAQKNNCMRIKILGDCYYCVSGLPISRPNHAINCVRMGLAMISIIQRVRKSTGIDVDMRIGVHSGNVLCGIIGLLKWQYDVWSDDVTLANLMESTGKPGKVHITRATLDFLNNEFEVEPAHAADRNPFLRENGIETFFIVPSPNYKIDDILQDVDLFDYVPIYDPLFVPPSSISNNKKIHRKSIQNESLNSNTNINTDEIKSRNRNFLTVNNDNNESRNIQGDGIKRLSSARERKSSTSLLNLKGGRKYMETWGGTKLFEPNIDITKKTLSVFENSMFGHGSVWNYKTWSNYEYISPLFFHYRDRVLESNYILQFRNSYFRRALIFHTVITVCCVAAYLVLFRRYMSLTIAFYLYLLFVITITLAYNIPHWLGRNPPHALFQNIFGNYQHSHNRTSNSRNVSTNIFGLTPHHEKNRKNSHSHVSTHSSKPKKIHKSSTALSTHDLVNSRGSTTMSPAIKFRKIGKNIGVAACIFFPLNALLLTTLVIYYRTNNQNISNTYLGSKAPLSTSNEYNTNNGIPVNNYEFSALSSLFYYNYLLALILISLATVSFCLQNTFLTKFIFLFLALVINITAILLLTRSPLLVFIQGDSNMLNGDKNKSVSELNIYYQNKQEMSKFHGSFTPLGNGHAFATVAQTIKSILKDDSLESDPNNYNIHPNMMPYYMTKHERTSENHRSYFRSRSIIALLLICICLCIYDRMVEYDNRLDFYWRSRFSSDREQLETMGSLNKVLLENILPAHIATYFLSNTKSFTSLYCESYESVAILFASIPNFKEFWDENNVTKSGLECMRLLNEIICEFDKLLLKPKYSSVEKIKTIGSTYMAASGLNAVRESKLTTNKRDNQIIAITEFAFSMISCLDLINKDSFNNFQLRIGINHGPIIAGIVGAQKPQFDIWGNAVNIASRMDSHGTMRNIQVPEQTANILMEHGYTCTFRGSIDIKGSGQMNTYFLGLEKLMRSRDTQVRLLSSIGAP